MTTTDQGHGPATGRRPRLARGTIVGWVLVILAATLASILLVANGVLRADVAAEANGDVTQEIEEFRTFAAEGQDPETGQPFTSTERMLQVFLDRQRAGTGELIMGYVGRDGQVLEVRGPEVPAPGEYDLAADQAFLDEVADATRAVSDVLDASDALGSQPYTLEVTTPGVSRPLTSPEHFRRNIGRLVAATAAGSTTTGRLTVVDGDRITLVVPAMKKTPERTVELDLTGTVVVTMGDVPLLSAETISELTRAHVEAQAAVTVITSVLEDAKAYGRIVRDAEGNVERIVEFKDASDAEREIREINSGIWAFDAAVLREFLPQLGTNNTQGEKYLTDVLGLSRGAGGSVAAHKITDTLQTEGVNNRAQLSDLGAELNRRTCERWMREGVTIVDPATTWIDVDVDLARDVLLHPGVILQGATTIGEGAIIGPDLPQRVAELGLDMRAALAGHDSYSLFDATDSLIRTGPTLTNVNDFRAVLVVPAG